MKMWAEVVRPGGSGDPLLICGRNHEPKLRMTETMNLLVSLAEGARFENPTAPETIGPDLISSFQTQSLTAESEADGEPIKRDRAR